MTKKTVKIKNALLKKGFSSKESDHTYFTFYLEGKQTNIRTKLSHGLREYGDDLLGKMARQLKLNKKELNDLIECPMDYKKYKEVLKTKNEI